MVSRRSSAHKFNSSLIALWEHVNHFHLAAAPLHKLCLFHLAAELNMGTSYDSCKAQATNHHLFSTVRSVFYSGLVQPAWTFCLCRDCEIAEVDDDEAFGRTYATTGEADCNPGVISIVEGAATMTSRHNGRRLIKVSSSDNLLEPILMSELWCNCYASRGRHATPRDL